MKKLVMLVTLGMVLCFSLAASAQENRSEISLQGNWFVPRKGDGKWYGLQRHKQRWIYRYLSIPPDSLDFFGRSLWVQREHPEVFPLV